MVLAVLSRTPSLLNTLPSPSASSESDAILEVEATIRDFIAFCSLLALGLVSLALGRVSLAVGLVSLVLTVSLGFGKEDSAATVLVEVSTFTGLVEELL